MQKFVVAHETHLDLAERIAEHLKLPLYTLQTTYFADSEMSVTFKESDFVAQQGHAIIVHSTSRPVNEHLMQLLFSLRMLKNAGVENITTVIPYFGYARQDRQINGESVAQFVIKLLAQAGADRIVTVELHNPRIMLGSPIPMMNISLSHMIAEHIKKEGPVGSWTVISPDHGALERVDEIARELDAPIVVNEKERYAVDMTRIIGSEGSCKTLSGIIVDDIIDTGSTILNVDKKLHEENSACRLFAFGVHAVLSGSAMTELQNSSLERIWVTNTVPWQQNELPSKFEVVNISKEIARHIADLI